MPEVLSETMSEFMSALTTTSTIYLVTGALLFGLGVVGLVLTHHLVRKVLALNIMASAVFLLLIVLAYEPEPAASVEPVGGNSRLGSRESTLQDRPGEPGDPVPQALVLTGIVVAFGSSALALGLARRLHGETGEARLPEEQA